MNRNRNELHRKKGTRAVKILDIEFKETFDFSGGSGLLLFHAFGITWLESELR